MADLLTITAVPGIRVGHFTDADAGTGCTAILCPPGTVGSCEVRGSSPGSRETALLAPEKQMQEIHAVVLTGGSAFGLGAANGVMEYLAGRGIGYRTPWGVVPIVPSAVIFDLNVGRPGAFPRPADGLAAAANAREIVEEGNVGAGTGASVGKWNGLEHAMKGGLGTACRRSGSLIVGALAVVNAVGDVVDDDGTIIAGAHKEGKFFGSESRLASLNSDRLLARNTNTTLIVIASNAKLGKVDTFRVAQRAHGGIVRSIIPAHTSFDGDTAFALSTGACDAPVDFVAELGVEAAAAAIRSAVRHAATRYGLKGLV